ncbi:polyribonucleotide nucleotidyltransferase [Desulfohalobium retbaense DSM 5692]|uniref:Polyribonucleotide nucleotidyltransferase n=2 Tax=Desulfohalobium TaxID=45662 RepID=C8X0G1_DESRD|nr:polyribonucleotide nucleotidyltransferase [Desulfohalobium retbaense DSM 5692]
MTMSNIFGSTSVSTTLQGQDILIETGRLANQANGAVWVQSGGTVVLVTAVTQPVTRDIDFMPLVVDYQEMSYASGRIPGNYFRREIGRPSERETLVSRLIDRPIRPLFPAGFRDEVQIIATVLSAAPEVNPDVLALTGASAAMHISDIPFDGPIGGIRVGQVDGEFVLNPSQNELENSDLNLVLAGSRDAVTMVEGGGNFVPEDRMAEAITWGHEQVQALLQLQDELREKIGAPKIAVQAPEADTELESRVHDLAGSELAEALQVPNKLERKTAKKTVKDKVMATLEQEFAEEPERLKGAGKIFEALEKDIVRKRVKETKTRIDGRDLTTVRDLNIETSSLPRTHGSAIFARGETKVLSVATLGSSRDEQRIEMLDGELNKRFMLHYNFPPYCVGEVKMMRGPARREIGHGALAERALTPVLPTEDEFPFTMRVVSEVMESNGSSSMATVCGTSLSLMDAGVPVSAPVAGIAMGLIKEEDEFLVLTDILGDEDHLGDMDFKVAGTAEGITAIQMDSKIAGIPPEVLKRALNQAMDARLHILDNMNTVLPAARAELSEHAPQLEIVEVDTERIKDVIGPGGKNIKAITQATGASIDIEDSGRISIFAPNQQALQEAVDMVLFYDQKAEVGKDYEGTVKRIMNFGAFVEILPGLEGLLHISQLDQQRVEQVEDVVKVGDSVKVKVIEQSGDGKIRLSRKAVLMEEQGLTFDLAAEARPSGPKKGPGGGGRGGRDNGPRGGGDRR